MPAQHLIRFPDEALGLGDALSEAVLACLDFCCVLLSPLSALFGVWHSGSTILAQLRTHDFQLSFSDLRRVSAFHLSADGSVQDLFAHSTCAADKLAGNFSQWVPFHVETFETP
jgi:hypothetical protein